MNEEGKRPTVEALLELSERNNIEIYTSVLSIVEVAFTQDEKNSHSINESVEETINNLWAPASPIKTIELYDYLAMKAKQLIRSGLEKGCMIKPADAIHLISAQSVGADEFHTYDKQLLSMEHSKLKSILGFKLHEPSLFDELERE